MILILMLSFCCFGKYSYAKPTNDADARIVGGYEISITQAPYQVSLRLIEFDENFGDGFFCGGSLIKTSVVLTAAHCLYDEYYGSWLNASDIQVVGGNSDLRVRDANTFVSTVSSFKVHEMYNSEEPNVYDIAVLKLERHITQNAFSTTKVISLPTQTYSGWRSCFISGWGSTIEDGETVQNLRGVYVTINSKFTCNLPRYLDGWVGNGMLCAGPFEGGRDSCQGDSGGPLVCDNAVYGIASHGFGCGEQDLPGIYTDVVYYREWILKNNASSKYFRFVIFFGTLAVTILVPNLF